MNSINLIQKLLDNNNLGIPNLYFSESLSNFSNNSLSANCNISNISDDKYNNILEKNIVKKKRTKKNLKKNVLKNTKKKKHK